MSQAIETSTYSVPLGVPIRFLVLSWDDGWEFGGPTVLLEPVVRYGVDSTHEYEIEDAAIDICVEHPEPVRAGLTEMELREFGWRHWSLSSLHKAAYRCLGGWKGGRRGYRAREEWLKFSVDAEGELTFEESPNVSS